MGLLGKTITGGGLHNIKMLRGVIRKMEIRKGGFGEFIHVHKSQPIRLCSKKEGEHTPKK